MSYRSAKRRRGYTLMEMVVATSSATLLMTGLASALLIATSSFNLDSGTQAKSSTAAQVQADLMADLQHALSFSERTATAVTFTVPDRDGDTNPETIRYAWSGTPGDPLTYQYNGGTVVNVAEDVQSFDLSYLTRLMVPFNCAPPTFEEFTETKRDSGTETITLSTPAGTLEGDLLIAALATDEEMSDHFVAPAGWTLIAKDSYSDDVALGVWWKIAGASEPSSHTFTWYDGESEEAYGWMMRFTGHDPVSPIHAHASDKNGNDYTPNSPAVTTTIDNTLILRLGAFDDDNVTLDVTGLSGHTTITMDESGSGDGTCSGGAGYEILETAGDSGTETFNLSDDEQSVTITVAIAGAGCNAPIPAGCSPPIYEGFAETIGSSDSTSITVSTPAGTAEGDLLIAAVATHGDNENQLSAPAGWTVLTGPHNNDHVTMGVWYKQASASESSSHNFSWSGGASEKSYGWIMRFTGHDPTNPIDDWAYALPADSTTPISPAVTTTAPNALILRLGAFHHGDINTDAPGVSGHTAITMDGNDKISGGAAYVSQVAAGDSGTSNFTQTNSQEAVTVTIAIPGAECGSAGSGGFSVENVLFVVTNSSSLTSEESARSTQLNTWGYTVNLISHGASQTEFDAAFAVNDVVYFSEEIDSATLLTKVRSASIGVVSGEPYMVDETGFASTFTLPTVTSIDITNNSHYITSEFSTGSLTILSSSQEGQCAAGTLSGSLTTLAEINDGGTDRPALAVIDTGGSLYGGGTAAGRRVQLPWGGTTFSFSALNGDGLTILQRSLEWAAGAE